MIRQLGEGNMYKRKASGHVLGTWRLWKIGVCHGQLKPQEDRGNTGPVALAVQVPEAS